MIQDGAGENFVSMTHVDVKHLVLVLVHTTGTGPLVSTSLMPMGKFDGARVSKTFTSLLAGLGFHEYHSFAGDSKEGGRPLGTGWWRSSTCRSAGWEANWLPSQMPPRKV